MKAPRVLIVRVGAMGDVLHTLPAVAALRRHCPEATIDWVVDERWLPLLACDSDQPIVSNVHRAATRLWSRSPFSWRTFASVRALRRSLRVLPYDVVVDLQGTLRSAVIGRWARSPVRFGFATPREQLALPFYTGTSTRRGRHVVEQNAALLSDAVKLPLAPIVPTLPRCLKADAWAMGVSPDPERPLALLATTAGWGAKQWPVSQFASLALTLNQRGWRVLLNAAHAEDPVPLAVQRLCGPTIEIVSPAVDGLLALTRRAGLVVGGDTGPVHLAAALGVPTVALFGPTDPARNGPWGPGHIRTLRSPTSGTSHKRTSIVDPGLAALPVDQVLDAVDEVVMAGSAMME